MRMGNPPPGGGFGGGHRPPPPPPRRGGYGYRRSSCCLGCTIPAVLIVGAVVTGVVMLVTAIFCINEKTVRQKYFFLTHHLIFTD